MPVMMTSDMTTIANNDADLVAASLSGDRDAFGRIVSRYQSLICSLAYSATGSLGASEDLAQETFITAWKHLRHLREQHKLRAWLCGIARNRINNTLRREGREPVRDAEPLEVVHESASAEPLPRDHTITKEEEAILWRSLERIPEVYREPLVLFYREHQSVEAVAIALELSEDAVKQRLSRGRKLLADEVAAFVEGALARTGPGKTFTIGVVAALSGITVSAQAATIGLAAAQGGAAAKSAGITGLLAALSSPLLVIAGNYLGYRLSMEEARTDNERQFVKFFYRRTLIMTLGMTALLAVATFWLQPPQFSLAAKLGVVFMSAIICFIFSVLVNVLATNAERTRYYTRILAEDHGGIIPKPAFDYRSRAAFLGLPLVHIRIGDRFDALQKPVKAWVAVGNYAIGGLVAFGCIVAAPFGVGLFSFGLIPFAGIAVGLIPLGGIAIGGWTCGALAIGWQSMGCFSIALNAAAGNIAIARDCAWGHLAIAAHVNEAASESILPRWYVQGGEFLQRYSLWLNFIWIAPLFIQWRIVAKHKANEVAAGNSN